MSLAAGPAVSCRSSPGEKTVKHPTHRQPACRQNRLCAGIATSLARLLLVPATLAIAAPAALAQSAPADDATLAIIEPYSASPAKLVVVVVNVTSSGQTVVWSKARNDTAASANQAPPSGLTVPSAIATTTGQVVVGRVTYAYSSPFANVMKSITGRDTYNLSHVFYLKPRQGTTIAFTS